MPFNPGDHVLVANFGRAVVREVRNGGRYLVELKGRAMVAAEAQLTRVEERKRQRGSAKVEAPVIRAADALARTNAASSLDEVRIIHGRSGGRLTAAVHERLRGLTAIRAFRLDPANPGVTIVSL